MNKEMKVYVRNHEGKRKTLKLSKHCGKFLISYQGLILTEEMLQNLKYMYEKWIIEQRKKLAIQNQIALKVSENTGKTPEKKNRKLIDE